MLFSKFSIVSIFGTACILKIEKFVFLKKSSIFKKPNHQKTPKTDTQGKKIPKHKKTPTLEDPFDPTVGANLVMEGITSE